MRHLVWLLVVIVVFARAISGDETSKIVNDLHTTPDIKKDTMEASRRVLEEARKMATERRNKPPQRETPVSGGDGKKPVKPVKPTVSQSPAVPPTQNKRAKLDKHARMKASREESKLKRERILQEHLDEMARKEVDDERNGILKRRKLSDEIAPNCDDQIANGLETDVDCGGATCRNFTSHKYGIDVQHLCHYAQKCEISSDCLSASCTKSKCDARPPFQVQSDSHLLRNIHAAFYQIASEKKISPDERGFITTADIDRYLALVVNPDSQVLTSTMKAYMDQLIANFRANQGLHAEEASLKLYLGFLGRGQPFNFIKQGLRNFQSELAKEL